MLTKGRPLIGAVKQDAYGLVWRERTDDGGVARHLVTIFFIDRTIDRAVNHTRGAVVDWIQTFCTLGDIRDSKAAEVSIYEMGAP